MTRSSAQMRARTYPHPYPDAWYRIASSKELKRGKIMYRECLGTQLVVFRSDKDDTVTAMGAFCPHLGAGLAQGRVVDGNLECPFHLWQLDERGSVASIPYTERKPSKPCQPTWPIVERYGQIFIYHRAAGGPQITPEAPPYPFPNIEDIDDGRTVYRGSYDAGRVHMHITEFAENSVDYQHFAALHGEMFVPWTRYTVPGITVEHDAEWTPDPDHKHVAYFDDRAVLKLFGRVLERTRTAARITFHGPGSVVVFRFEMPGAGEIVIFQTHLPMSPMEQQLNFHWFATKAMPRWLVFYVVGNWISQWRNDISVWENKIFLPKPMLVQGDGPVHKLRRWFSQFYPSVTAREADFCGAPAQPGSRHPAGVGAPPTPTSTTKTRPGTPTANREVS